ESSFPKPDPTDTPSHPNENRFSSRIPASATARRNKKPPAHPEKADTFPDPTRCPAAPRNRFPQFPGSNPVPPPLPENSPSPAAALPDRRIKTPRVARKSENNCSTTTRNPSAP